ncbi:MAG: hypothetical protein ACLQJR_33075 [Stellaceae bacterium]
MKAPYHIAWLNRQPSRGPRRGAQTAQEPTEKMGKFALIAAAALAVIVIGIAGTLMFWNAPAPSARVEHVIPDAKLPK